VKITKAIEEKIEKGAEEKFIEMTIQRIVDKVFTDSVERINHYIEQEAAKLGKQISADFPL